MPECEYCGIEIKNKENYRRHIRRCDGSGTLGSRRPGQQTCQYCNRTFQNRANWNRHIKHCQKIVGVDLQTEYNSGLSIQQIADKYNVGYKFIFNQGLKTRKKKEATAIRQKKSPEIFFFGGTRKRSKGEQRFREMLELSNLPQQYNIEEQYRLFGYKLDFSFLNIKLDVEIDGIQHYTKQKIKAKDRKREAILLNAGWTVYRIASKDFLARTNIIFNLFEEFLKTQYPCKVFRYNGQVVDGDKRWIKEREKKILSSGINFKKSGWSVYLGKLLNIHSWTAARWVANNMPKFYKEECRTPRADYINRTTR